MATHTTSERPLAAAARRDGHTVAIVVLLLAGVAWAVLVARNGLPDLSGSGCAHAHGAAPCAPAGPGGVTGSAAPAGPDDLVGSGSLAGSAGSGSTVDPQRMPGSQVVTAARMLDSWTGWIVMVVAMMLPPALPLLRVVRRLARRQPQPGLLVAYAGLAFVGVWAAAGVLLIAIDTLVVALDPPVLRDHPQLTSGFAAIAAGLYQFTPLKRACLTACRSPFGIAATRWTGLRPPTVQAAGIGLRFGLVCVGCCWALMLLTLAVGIAALPLMVAASVLMALERLAPSSRSLVPLLGAGAVVLGLLILLGLLPSGLPVVKGHH